MATNKQELSSKDLALVLRELFTVQDKWHNIGLSLGLLPVTLTGIQNENQKEENCLRVMLNQRINQEGLTWEKIAEALEDVTVGRKVEAREIRAKYCTPVATQTVLTAPPISSTNPANPIAGLSTQATPGLLSPVNNTPPENRKVSSIIILSKIAVL